MLSRRRIALGVLFLLESGSVPGLAGIVRVASRNTVNVIPAKPDPSWVQSHHHPSFSSPNYGVSVATNTPGCTVEGMKSAPIISFAEEYPDNLQPIDMTMPASADNGIFDFGAYTLALPSYPCGPLERMSEFGSILHDHATHAGFQPGPADRLGLLPTFGVCHHGIPIWSVEPNFSRIGDELITSLPDVSLAAKRDSGPYHARPQTKIGTLRVASSETSTTGAVSLIAEFAEFIASPLQWHSFTVGVPVLASRRNDTPWHVPYPGIVGAETGHVFCVEVEVYTEVAGFPSSADAIVGHVNLSESAADDDCLRLRLTVHRSGEYLAPIQRRGPVFPPDHRSVRIGDPPGTVALLPTATLAHAENHLEEPNSPTADISGSRAGVVPEPATLMLMVGGAAIVVGRSIARYKGVGPRRQAHMFLGSCSRWVAQSACTLRRHRRKNERLRTT